MGIFKDENGRSYGDWTHRDQRSREEANRIVKDPNEKKWYDQNFYIIMFLLLFWPVGIVLVWRSYWHVAAKVAASVFVAFCVYVVWNMNQAVMAMGY